MTEVAAAIQRLKSGNTADEGKIRPEMFKPLNRERVHWLTRGIPVHNSEKHDPEWTQSRMDTIPNGHNPEWTQS